MAVIIRDALAHEINEITSLMLTAYYEYSHVMTLDNWEIMQINLSRVAAIAKLGQLIVAQHNNAIVGSVIYHPPEYSKSLLIKPEWASLRMLAVLPQYRGQGIGSQLTLECIHRAKQDHAEVVGLHTSELMVAARRMYEKLGFKLGMKVPCYLRIQYWQYVLSLVEESSVLNVTNSFHKSPLMEARSDLGQREK